MRTSLLVLLSTAGLQDRFVAIRPPRRANQAAGPRPSGWCFRNLTLAWCPAVIDVAPIHTRHKSFKLGFDQAAIQLKTDYDLSRRGWLPATAPTAKPLQRVWEAQVSTLGLGPLERRSSRELHFWTAARTLAAMSKRAPQAGTSAWLCGLAAMRFRVTLSWALLLAAQDLAAALGVDALGLAEPRPTPVAPTATTAAIPPQLPTLPWAELRESLATEAYASLMEHVEWFPERAPAEFELTLKHVGWLCVTPEQAVYGEPLLTTALPDLSSWVPRCHAATWPRQRQACLARLGLAWLSAV